MSNNHVIEKIKKFLIEEFEVEKDIITPEANLKTTLNLDSLDFIDLAVVIENNFKFKVKPEDFSGIITFEDFCNYIISKVNAKELV